MSTSEPLTFYTDRSAAETDDKCGHAFYLNRIAGKRGIVPRKQSEALAVGATTHDDLAGIAALDDISVESITEVVGQILADVTTDDLRGNQRRAELLYRRLGWLVAFALYVEPIIRRDFENVSIESEIALDRTPLIVGVTPDRLLRHRKDRYLVYREYKSTISSGPKWLDSWKYAIQLHSSMKAVEEELGEPVRYSQVMGLMKGYQGESENSRLMHPYAWGYYNANKDEWSHEYQRGSQWEPMPVWEYPDGIVKWVQKCGEDVARNQFPHTEPIFLDEEFLNDWVRRRTAREQQIELMGPMAKEDAKVRSVYFEKRTRNCRPAFGDACPYLPICWNHRWDGKEDQHPDFVERVPHHDLELIL